MRCPNCGTENPEGARFCKNCGFQLLRAETPPQSPGNVNNIPGPPPPPQQTPPPPPQPQQQSTYPPPPSSPGGMQPPYTPPPQGPQTTEKESWWNSLIFCLLISLFCCWPIGVILYWLNPVASKKSKIIFTAVFVGLFILIMLFWGIGMLTTMRHARY